MKAKLYDLMNWAQIEGIVYSEEDRPGTILGPHVVGNSTLYQTFYPGAKKVTLILEDKGKKVAMDMADEEGFFAATAAGKKNGAYSYEIVTEKKEKVIIDTADKNIKLKVISLIIIFLLSIPIYHKVFIKI